MATSNQIKAWKIIALNKIQDQLLTPSSSFLFIIGKFLNFIFSILIIFSIFKTTRHLHGYTLEQALIVALVFNFIDTFTQFLFRSLYTFRPILLKGDYDLDLLKPLPASFRPLLSGPDFLDLPLIMIKLSVLIFYLIKFQLFLSPQNILIFIVFLILALIVSFFIHLLIAAICLLTTEVDNLIGIYRSLGQAAVIPTDIYQGAFKFILDFVIPVTITFTIPAKTLLGIATAENIIYTLIIGSVFSFISYRLWQYALKNYSSTGS